MKNETLYNKTVDILVQAYFNDTLVASKCEACVIGNIVAANNGYKIEILNEEIQWFDKENKPIEPKWSNVFVSAINPFLWGLFRTVKQEINLNRYYGSTRKEIDSTGYSLQELAKIESSFEKAYCGFGDRMFKGLMAVIDVLDTIHENTDTQVTTQTKNKFVKQLA